MTRANTATNRLDDRYAYVGASADYFQVPRTLHVQSKQRKPHRQEQMALQVFVVVALVFMVVQCARSITTGVLKSIRLLQHNQVLEELYDRRVAQTTVTQSKIKRYSSAIGVEELARNQLQMIGQDEILVQINR